MNQNEAPGYVGALLTLGGLVTIILCVVQMCYQTWIDICTYGRMIPHIDAIVLFAISLGLFTTGVVLVTYNFTRK